MAMKDAQPQHHREDSDSASKAERVLKKVLMLLAALVVSGIAGYGLDWALHVIMGPTSTGSVHNGYWAAFFAIIFFIGSCFFILRRQFACNPEYVFLVMILCICTFFAYSQSFWEAGWDEGIHFKSASLVLDEGDTYGSTKAEEYIFTSVDPVTEIIVNQISDMPLQLLSERENALNEAYGAEAQDIRDAVVPSVSTIVYLPSALVIQAAKQLGLPFWWIYFLGKVPCILIYSLLTFFGMRKLRAGKALFAAVALIPTSVFLAASYTYSYWTAGFVLFGFAYLVSMLQAKERASWRDIILMLVSLSLACLPRLAYFPLIFAGLVIPTSRFVSKRTAYAYRAVIILGSLLTASIFFVPTAMHGLGIGDARGGDYVSPADQTAYILAHPVDYLQTLGSLLFGSYTIEGGKPDTESAYLISGFLTPQALPGYLVNYGYMPRAPYGFGYFLAIFLLFVALTDKDAEEKMGVIPAVVTIVLCVLAAFLLITYLYLLFNNVGGDVIRGIQRRYFLPFIYPTLAFIGLKKWNLCGGLIPKGAYNASVMGIMVAVLMGSYWMSYLFQLN